jgi:hypothetical protein
MLQPRTKNQDHPLTKFSLLSPVFSFVTNDIFQVITILSPVCRDWRECIQHYSSEMWIGIVTRILRMNSSFSSSTSDNNGNGNDHKRRKNDGLLDNLDSLRKFARIFGLDKSSRVMMMLNDNQSHLEFQDPTSDELDFDQKDSIFNLSAWCIQALVRQGNFDVSKTFLRLLGTPLQIAVSHANVKITRFLLETARVDPNFVHDRSVAPPVLFLACSQILDHKIEVIVEDLLRFGADPECTATTTTISDRVLLLQQNQQQISSSISSNKARKEFALNRKIEHPLIVHAAMNSSVSVVQKLINAIKAENPKFRATFRTPEMVSKSVLNILEKLINENRERDAEMIKLLIFGGGNADVNEATFSSSPPLVRAAFLRNLPAFRLLLKTWKFINNMKPVNLIFGFRDHQDNRTALILCCRGEKLYDPDMPHEMKRIVMNRKSFSDSSDDDEEENSIKIKEQESSSSSSDNSEPDEDVQKEIKHLDSLLKTVSEDDLVFKMVRMLLQTIKQNKIFEKKEKDFLEYLNQEETNSGLNALMFACVNGYPKTVKYLLESGASATALSSKTKLSVSQYAAGGRDGMRSKTRKTLNLVYEWVASQVKK